MKPQLFKDTVWKYLIVLFVILCIATNHLEVNVCLRGDFRQILLVIRKGRRAAIIDACINSSHLWDHCVVFHLTKNMRLVSSSSPSEQEKLKWFSKWLLDIRDGSCANDSGSQMKVIVPNSLLVPTQVNPLDSSDL